MRVQVVMAWPDGYRAVELELAEGATVAEAVGKAALDPDGAAVAQAVHGVLAKPGQVLRDGDRVELLRPLLADPKENRRRRARGGV